MRAEHVPAALLTLLVGVIVVGAMRSSDARQRQRDARVAPPPTLSRVDTVAHATTLAPAPADPTRTPPEELRRRVANLAPGTYVNDVLAEQDSVLYRWPDRLGNAMRVYVQPSADIPDWSDAYPAMARTVFDEWSLAGFPLRFTFVYDSTNADISIRWVARFPVADGQKIGETERIHTRASLIARANVLIANHDSTGRALSATTVGGVVRHEVGHALGLNHAADSTSVMFHESATATIGASDRATLRLLYLVPAGSLK